MLAKLDELEDHPNYYQRRIETVIKNDDKKGLFKATNEVRKETLKLILLDF